MSKVVVVETRRQNASITTIRVETVVVPTMDVVKRGVLIGFETKLGSGSGGILIGRKLSGSSTLPTTIGIVGTL